MNDTKGFWNSTTITRAIQTILPMILAIWSIELLPEEVDLIAKAVVSVLGLVGLFGIIKGRIKADKRIA